jgi:hypothetical protein
VHQLVLLAFRGPCPSGMECLHNDDVKNNNELTNLRYGTRSENNKDRVRTGHDRWTGHIKQERNERRRELYAKRNEQEKLEDSKRRCAEYARLRRTS